MRGEHQLQGVASHLSRHAEVAHLTGTKASASGVVSTLLPVHASFMRVRVCQPEGYCQSLTGEPIVVYPAHQYYGAARDTRAPDGEHAPVLGPKLR